MPEARWRLHDAKKQFSAVVAGAESGEPQLVTKRGRPAVVVLSIEEYQRLCGQRSPPQRSFIEHILTAPKRPPEISDEEELFPRLDLEPRDLT